jgi:hypothetical protein
MGRLTPEERALVSRLKNEGLQIKFLVQSFHTSRQTIWFWCSQDLRTRFDIPRDYRGKISVEVESAILYFRSFGFGCARIQQRLISAPSYELAKMEIIIQDFPLSRQAINEILKKHKINGYQRKFKKWKFFRAKSPDELWQLDLKGPFKYEGKKHWILAVIDDHSRYYILLKLFDHSLKISEICQTISTIVRKHNPKNILTDNNPFKEDWKNWCIEQGINPIFAHPYYPQDKGKVERAIRTLTEEFINILVRFPDWLRDKLEEWRQWYNEKRYHRGIKDYPSNLYVKL